MLSTAAAAAARLSAELAAAAVVQAPLPNLSPAPPNSAPHPGCYHAAMPAHPGGPSPMAAPRSKAYLALLLSVVAAAGLIAGGANGWRPDGGGSGGGDDWHKPGYCGSMDCPRFTIWQVGRSALRLKLARDRAVARGLLPLPRGGAAGKPAACQLFRARRTAAYSRWPALPRCACLQSSASQLLLCKSLAALAQKSYDFQHRQYQEGGQAHCSCRSAAALWGVMISAPAALHLLIFLLTISGVQTHQTSC